MDPSTRALLALAAEALRYPAPGQAESIQAGLDALPDRPEMRPMRRFAERLTALSLGDAEELYTRTYDLNPPGAPYLGYQVWGEGYQRGAFLATLNRALLENNIDADGELPDHLIPVLRYLGQVERPLPELLETLQPALQRMRDALKKADPDNLYLLLLESVQGLCSQSIKEAA